MKYIKSWEVEHPLTDLTSFTMKSSSLLTLLLVLLSACCPLVRMVSSPLTFQHRDPTTGRSLQCDGCPPGTYLRARCAPNRRSLCAPCPEGSFTKLWNYIGQCLRCGVCGRNQVVKKECAADSDCQCECKQGYYYNQEYSMCFPHSECPTGQGVLAPGTAERDTVCSICSNNTFSNVSSARDGCRRLKICGDAGLQRVLRGSAWHDSVCADCREVKDGAEYLKEILPAFFAHHKMKTRRLRRLVRKLPTKAKLKGGPAKPSFSELQSRISSWISSASPTDVQQLPDVVYKVRGRKTGEKLKKKLNQINTHLEKHCNSGSERLLFF